MRNTPFTRNLPGLWESVRVIRWGSIGVVRDVGSDLQDQVIYTVHYLEADKIVGCREEELLYADEPWTPSKYKVREKVRCDVIRAEVAPRIRLVMEQNRRKLCQHGWMKELQEAAKKAQTAEEH